MASLDMNLNIQDVIKKNTLVVNLRIADQRQFDYRLKIAKVLVKLAGWVLGFYRTEVIVPGTVIKCARQLTTDEVAALREAWMKTSHYSPDAELEFTPLDIA